MKKNIIRCIPFVIIPLLLLGLHGYFFSTTDNPVNTINIDPDYAYLLSAVDLANLGMSKMVLHPGTTFQLLSHLVLRTAYFFNPGTGDSFQVSVLKNPFFYLTFLQRTFILLNLICVLALGIITYRVTKNTYAGLLVQLTPFFSSSVLIFGFRKVTADTLLISVCLVLNILLIKWLHSQSPGGTNAISRQSIYWYALGLGVLSGFAMATKVIFLVVLIVPFMILPSFRSRVIYLAGLIAGVFMFTLPIVSQYPIFYRFIVKIFTHKGIYGQGKPAVFDIGEYSSNLGKLLTENLPFLLLIVIGFVFLTIIYIKSQIKRNIYSIFSDLPSRMVTALLMAQILGIVVVARHFKSKYLLPVLCLSPLLLYLLYFFRNYAESGKRFSIFSKKWFNVAVVCFIIFCFSYTMYGLNQYHRVQSARIREAAIIKQKIAGEYKHHGIIYYYNAPSEIFGLEFGHQWTPAFREALSEIYGKHYFYNFYSRSFYSWDENEISLKELKNRCKDRLILLGNPFRQIQERRNIRLPDFPLREIFSGTYYRLYAIL